MILVIPQLLVPMVAMIGLNHLLRSQVSEQEKWKLVKLTGIALGALLVLATLFYFGADYSSEQEQQISRSLKTGNPQVATPVSNILKAAAADRQSLFGKDLLRTLAFAGLGFILLAGLAKGKIGKPLVLGGLLLLCTIDLLAVGKRYLNDSNYEPKEELEVKPYVAATNPGLYQALTSIEKDTDPHYRVLNLTGDVFNDALTSGFVRSVGGYHPAKLSIYQDLIEYQLGAGGQPNMEVLNMLNTRYVIVPGAKGPQVQQNPAAYGPAWLVKAVQFVPNAAAEMKALNTTNLRDTAIVQSSFKEQVALALVPDSTASIQLVSYDNMDIVYNVNAPTPQFAVLSDIYYSRGWNAYADGKAVPIVKTNYVLRGVALPAGTKKLELKFEPQSYAIGKTVTLLSSILLTLLLIGAFYLQFKPLGKKTSAISA